MQGFNNRLERLDWPQHTDVSGSMSSTASAKGTADSETFTPIVQLLTKSFEERQGGLAVQEKENTFRLSYLATTQRRSGPMASAASAKVAANL
jgi:hypothetical protein